MTRDATFAETGGNHAKAGGRFDACRPPHRRSVINNSTTSSAADSALERARLCARIADEFKAQDIVLLDLRSVTPVVDFFVIATAGSQRQMLAISEEVRKTLKRFGEHDAGGEDDDSGRWMLQDYGDVVLHLFNAEARAVYDLEGLWADATTVDLNDETV